MNTIQRITYLLLITMLWTTSCKKKETSWDVELLTPLVQGELSITDILPDSLTQIETDESVTLVFRETLIDYHFAEENITIPDTIITTFVSLDSLSLDDRTISQQITLGDVATALGFPIGTFIILSNGSEAVIDPIEDLSSGEQAIDATSFFESATIETGFLDIEVYNGFPIPLADIQLEIRNSSDGVIIVSEFIDYIEPGALFTSTTSLDGKTVDGNLIAEIYNFNSPGSSGIPVLIDTSDAMVITMTAYDLSLLEATAIFPAQNLIDKSNNIVYNMGGPQFTEMKIATGEVIMYIVNTIQDSIYIEYAIPGAVDAFGNPVFITTTVPPAPPGGNVIFDQEFPLDDYTIDLRGESGLSYNTFYNQFLARIDSTGEVVTISLEDSIEVLYGLTNIIPKELKGYFGQETITIGDTVGGLSFFDQITGGTLELSDGAVNLVLSNGVGIESTFNVAKLTAINSRTGQQVNLSAGGVVGAPLSLPRALNNPFIPGELTIELNPSNSNILDVLSILPDQLIYEISMEVNPEGNVYNFQDFFIEQSRIHIYLDMEIPLEFIASDLVLQNNVNTNFQDIEDRESIVSGTFTLHAENGFPFSAQLSMDFYDRDNAYLTTLQFDEPIEAGLLNSECRVGTPGQSAPSVVIDEDTMKDILRAARAVVTTQFNTESAAGCPEPVKVYSDYKLGFQLSAQFNYGVNVGL